MRDIPTIVTQLVLIGAILVVIAAGFAFASGWLTSDQVNPGEIVDSQLHDGSSPDFLLAHVKALNVKRQFPTATDGTPI